MKMHVFSWKYGILKPIMAKCNFCFKNIILTTKHCLDLRIDWLYLHNPFIGTAVPISCYKSEFGRPMSFFQITENDINNMSCSVAHVTKFWTIIFYSKI